MTRQEIYNKVRDHLLKQNAKAVDKRGDCQYRAPDGKMCAVGCLIPDSRYTPYMEGRLVGALINVYQLLPPVSVKTLCLLRALQSVHDGDEPPQWPAALSEVARQFGLQP